MSISYKKITSMISEVVEGDAQFKDLNSKVLEGLCIEIYTVESSLDGASSSSNVRADIKGKIATRFSKILEANE